MKKYKGFNTAIGIFIIILIAIGVNLLFVYSNKQSGSEIVEKQKTLEELTDEEKESLKKFNSYKFKYSYIVTSYGYVPKFVFRLAVPFEMAHQQQITNFKSSIEPEKIYPRAGNHVYEYVLKDLNSGDVVTIEISGTAKVRTYNLLAAKLLKVKVEEPKDKKYYLQRYLDEEKSIEVNSERVQKIASEITGNSKEEIVDKIYDYVFNNVEYTQWVGQPSAELTLKSRRGKCLDLSLAMVALCRAKGIPARIVSGNIAREENQNHTWVEVWFDEYGWVTYDPTVQIAYKNYYHNGMFRKRVKIKQRPKLNYIASYINAHSPWLIKYDVENMDVDKINISSKTEISKVEE